MTQRLPIPGEDNDAWGTILNAFLAVAHNNDGSLVPSAVQAVLPGPSVQTVAYAATIIPSISQPYSTTIIVINPVTGSLTIAAPAGTPVDGQKVEFRLKDNGTGQALTWDAVFAPTGNVFMPATTTASTRLHVGFEWDQMDAKWYCLGVA